MKRWVHSDVAGFVHDDWVACERVANRLAQRTLADLRARGVRYDVKCGREEICVLIILLLAFKGDQKGRTKHLSTTNWLRLLCLWYLVCLYSVSRWADCIRKQLQKCSAICMVFKRKGECVRRLDAGSGRGNLEMQTV